VAASLEQWRVADAKAEQKAVRVAFGQSALGGHCGKRIADPDVGDAGCHRDAFGRRQDQPGVAERLAAECFAEPDGAVAERFDLGGGLPDRGGWLAVKLRQP